MTTVGSAPIPSTMKPIPSVPGATEEEEEEEKASAAATTTIAVRPTLDVAKVVAKLPVECTTLAVKGRSLVMGASVIAVGMKAVDEIAASRKNGKFSHLVLQGIFAVGVAYTTSASWQEDYSKLENKKIFEEFEVDGRTAVKVGDKNINWMVNSKMNASAVRLFGHLIVFAADEDTFLGRLRKSAYTIFMEIPEAEMKPRTVLMREARKDLSAKDKEFADVFKKHFSKFANVVSLVFGDGGGDYTAAVAKAASLPAYEIWTIAGAKEFTEKSKWINMTHFNFSALYQSGGEVEAL